MKTLRITVEGKTYDVTVELLEEQPTVAGHTPVSRPTAPVATPQKEAPAPAVSAIAAGGGNMIASPMAGTVFKCPVKPGDAVQMNQVVMILEAMKMETPIFATAAGMVQAVLVKEGDTVDEGQGLVQIAG